MITKSVHCPVCNTQLIALIREQKDAQGPLRPEGLSKFFPKDGDTIKLEAEKYVLDAIRAGCHFNREIGDYVLKNDPEWRWKGPHLIGFVLTKMTKEGTILRSPVVKQGSDGSHGHYVGRYDLPEKSL